MSAAHPACRDPETLLAECELRRTRRSGPGGQRRNKVETAVVLRHDETGLQAEAGERRSQQENRRSALKRLRLRLALEVRTAMDPSRPPSRLWQSRCRGGRVVINPEHDDFPCLLAEALDTLFWYDMEVKPAANRLGVSSSQLIKFFKLQPQAWTLINRRREEQGRHRLK